MTIPKHNYSLRLDFGPWLEKLKYDQYVLVHSQDRPAGQQLWGVLVVDGQNVSYQEAVKVESHQPHEGWMIKACESLTPRLAWVYPACRISTQPQGTITIESIGFSVERATD